MRNKIFFNLFFDKKIIFLFLFSSIIYLTFFFDKVGKFSTVLSIEINNDRNINEFFNILDIEDRNKYYSPSFQRFFKNHKGQPIKNYVLKNMFGNKYNFTYYRNELLNSAFKDYKNIIYDYSLNVNSQSLLLNIYHDNEIDLLINDLKNYLSIKFSINNLKALQEEVELFKNKNTQTMINLEKLKKKIPQIQAIYDSFQLSDLIGDNEIFLNFSDELYEIVPQLKSDNQNYFNLFYLLVELHKFPSDTGPEDKVSSLYDNIDSKIGLLTLVNSIDFSDYFITNNENFDITIVSNNDFKLTSNLEILIKMFFNITLCYLVSFISINSFKRFNLLIFRH